MQDRLIPINIAIKLGLVGLLGRTKSFYFINFL